MRIPIGESKKPSPLHTNIIFSTRIFVVCGEFSLMKQASDIGIGAHGCGEGPTRGKHQAKKPIFVHKMRAMADQCNTHNCCVVCV